MKDLIFTTAGDYMKDVSQHEFAKNFKEYVEKLNKEAKERMGGSFRNPGSWREPELKTVTVMTQKREITEIINTIILREYNVMRYELGLENTREEWVSG